MARRRWTRGNPLTAEIDYADDERELIAAMARYQQLQRRPFPTLSEILAVLRSLGWRRVAERGPLPKWPLQ